MRDPEAPTYSNKGGADGLNMSRHDHHDLLVYDKGLQDFQRRTWRIKLQTFPPQSPSFNVGGVCTGPFEGNSAHKSLQHRYQNRANIEIGGAGADRRHKVGSCQVHVFLQVSLSAVLQTFVRHLSD